MDTKKLFSLFFAFAVFLSLFAPVAARADIASGAGTGAEMGSGATKPYRRDENYVDVQPGDIDVWDNGNGISISGGGETYSVNYRSDGSEYAALISKYLDADGEYTVQVDIYLHRGNVLALDTGTSYNTNDGSVYNKVYIRGTSGFAWQGEYHCVLVRGGLFKAADGSWTESPSSNYFDNIVSSSPGRLGDIYSSPFFGGKYLVYSSYEYRDESYPTYVGFPVNLLPNAPLGTGSTSIPYKTTFRMLTGETTVYNTFYYTSSYMSGADEISASGTIRLDATKLADGSVTRTRPSAPQLLCQKSTYGTVYDIVYTNDDNLLSLLGISKPPDKYWDVSAQEWKNVQSGGSSGGGSSGGGNGGSGIDSSLLVEDTSNLSTIKNLTLKLVGEDALIDAVRFNDYYANQMFHENVLEDLNTPVWGLGNYITWEYDGALNDPGEGDTLITSYKNRRRVKLVVKAKFRIDASTTKTLTYTLYDYDTSFGIAIGTGSRKISFYDLCLYFQSAYPEYITDFPTQLQQVSYYLTPFYYGNDDGKYHYGSTSQITQNVKSALADYSGGEWDGDNGGWSDVTESPSFSWDSALGFFDNIANFVSDLFSPIRNFAEQLGQVGGLFGKLFSFLPNEVSGYLQMAFMGCLVLGVIRWLRG